MTPEEIVEKRVSIAISALKAIKELSTDSVIRKMADDALEEIIFVRVRASNRPPFETFKRPICRGSIMFGSACGHCERCTWEKNQKDSVAALSVESGESTPQRDIIAEKERLEIKSWIEQQRNDYESLPEYGATSHDMFRVLKGRMEGYKHVLDYLYERDQARESTAPRKDTATAPSKEGRKEIMSEINLNDYVYVRLTDYGRSVEQGQYARWHLDPEKHLRPAESGWNRYQLHEFMNLFAAEMYAGNPQSCIVDNVIRLSLPDPPSGTPAAKWTYKREDEGEWTIWDGDGGFVAEMVCSEEIVRKFVTSGTPDQKRRQHAPSADQSTATSTR